MLVILSFGLVLLATILLVVGLLDDDGIQLIYFSIAASAAAAVVLYLAFRRARPEGAAASSGPVPLDRDLDAIVHDTDDHRDVTATSRPAPAPPPASSAGVPPTTAAPAAVAIDETDLADDQEAWADDADWEVDDLEFPIADYDELSVAEIMPLLPQLYSDELDIVYEREQSSKNRATILARLDELKETGTDADAEEAGVAPVADPVDLDPGPAAEAEPVPGPAPEPAEVAPVAPAPAPATRSMSLIDDDEDDDDDAFFPIADYDDLSVSQIIPLLPQLEDDELEDVRAREVAGANRATLVAEIDRYLAGEAVSPGWRAAAAVDEPADLAPPAPGAFTSEPAAHDGHDRLPIPGYDTMTVAAIRPRLAELSEDELEVLLRYEEERDNRRTITSEIRRRLMAGSPIVTSSSAPEAPVERAPRKAAKAGGKATGTPARKAAATRATKAPAKRAAKAAATRSSTRFPIADYDEMSVAQIRPRLARLSRAQLEQVRERELTGSARRTILNDVEARLR